MAINNSLAALVTLVSLIILQGCGGDYDGMYIDDYEFTDTGDLDACNGMTVNGQYGYYITDAYPWVVGCFKGTLQTSFVKEGG